MTALCGLMQDTPLLISSFLRYAETYHGEREIVSLDQRRREHRYAYRQAALRSRCAAQALLRTGIRPGDRVATLAMNTHRHFELFYAVSGIGAVLHTVNPRLFVEQIIYICNHAEDRILLFDPQFAGLIATIAAKLKTVERFIVLGDVGDIAEVESFATTAGDKRLIAVEDYETFLAAQDGGPDWPSFDERTASSLCYTSGTTGMPKGVLYSHRSTVLHAFAACQNSAMGLSAHDVIMPIAPMYHANAWSMPYLAPMLGAKLVLPGPWLDAESVQRLIEHERVSFTVAVPTIFTALLQYLERTGHRIDTLKKATIGGTAVPPAMIDLLQHKYDCFVTQVWGMTELSPLGTMTTLTPAVLALPPADAKQVLYKQGRVQFGLELKLVDGTGNLSPRDGVTPGAIWVRGPWAAAGYFKGDGGDVLDADGWFPTGDVGTLDSLGYLRITDRVKDLVKSGGEWISTVELENIAYEHPAVQLAGS